MHTRALVILALSHAVSVVSNNAYYALVFFFFFFWSFFFLSVLPSSYRWQIS